MHRLLVLLVVALAASGRAVSAQPMNCGAAPRLPVESQQEEKIKVELTGKAQFFSRMAGDSGLKNAVEAERRTIYQSANTIQAAWESAYLSYLFCSTVISDKSLSAQGKLGAILEFRKGMCTVPQDLLIKLAEFVNKGARCSLHSSPPITKQPFNKVIANGSGKSRNSSTTILELHTLCNLLARMQVQCCHLATTGPVERFGG